jgi:hypothetical protein
LDVINMYIKTNKKHSTMTIAKTLNALIWAGVADGSVQLVRLCVCVTEIQVYEYLSIRVKEDTNDDDNR